MSILTFFIPSEGKSHPHSIDINDWRFMTRMSYHYGNSSWTEGTKIVLQDDMIDVMGYTPSMIHNIILNNNIVENCIYTSCFRDHPSYCFHCGGSGNVDWVTAAMKNPNQSGRGRYARLFERDESVVLLYSEGSDIHTRCAFARTKMEAGYKLCSRCSGTGLNLDARQRVFSGMPGLRYKIKEYSWNGLILP